MIIKGTFAGKHHISWETNLVSGYSSNNESWWSANLGFTTGVGSISETTHLFCGNICNYLPLRAILIGTVNLWINFYLLITINHHYISTINHYSQPFFSIHLLWKSASISSALGTCNLLSEKFLALKSTSKPMSRESKFRSKWFLRCSDPPSINPSGKKCDIEIMENHRVFTNF